MRLYLDNCCFNRPYDDQSQVRVEIETKAKLYIQDLIVNGKVEFVILFMSEVENDANPFAERQLSISSFFDYAVEKAKPLDEIKSESLNIVKNGLHSEDAIHLASAINTKCDYFLTTDDKVLKYKNGDISIINPTEFLRIWEEHNYE